MLEAFDHEGRDLGVDLGHIPASEPDLDEKSARENDGQSNHNDRQQAHDGGEDEQRADIGNDLDEDADRLGDGERHVEGAIELGLQDRHHHAHARGIVKRLAREEEARERPLADLVGDLASDARDVAGGEIFHELPEQDEAEADGKQQAQGDGDADMRGDAAHNLPMPALQLIDRSRAAGAQQLEDRQQDANPGNLETNAKHVEEEHQREHSQRHAEPPEHCEQFPYVDETHGASAIHAW